MMTYFAISFILFLSAFIHGVVGFAFALTALPLLALVFSVKEAVPLMALYSLIVNIVMLVLMKEKNIFRVPFIFLFSILFGVVIGIHGFILVSEIFLRVLLFVTILLFLILEFYKIKVEHGNYRKYTDVINVELFKHPFSLISGFIAGLLGGLLNTPGPPLIICLSFFKLNKNLFKATLQLILAFTAFSAVLNHFIVGNITSKTLKLFILNMPFVLIGLFLGQKLYNRLTTKFYYYLVNLMLLISGVLLLIKNH